MDHPAPGLRAVPRHAGFAVYPAGSTFGPRVLRDWELVWIRTGQVVWEPEGREVPAPPGTLLLCRPGMRDGFRWDPRGLTRHGFVHFDFQPEACGLPQPAAWPLARSAGPRDVAGPLCEHLLWLWRTRPVAWEETAASALAHLLLVFLRGTGGADPAPVASHPLVRRALQFVQGRWGAGPMEPLTLGDLARGAGVTRAHLARVFRAQTGLSPLEALRLIRLDRAETLLARTNLPVQEVAALTGFDDPFHFSRAFRAVFRHPPRAWRRARLAGEPLAHPAFSVVRAMWEGM